MKVVDSIFRGIDLVSIWVGKAVAYLLIPMVLALVYEVFSRYMFNSPTLFAHETGLYLYAVNGMMAGAWVLFHDEHVRMDALHGRCSPKVKSILDIATAPHSGHCYSTYLLHLRLYGLVARRNHVVSVNNIQ